MTTGLERFGQRRPVLGGIVAGVVWGGAMFLVFALTRFRYEALNAVMWSLGGIAFGFLTSRKWARGRRKEQMA